MKKRTLGMFLLLFAALLLAACGNKRADRGSMDSVMAETAAANIMEAEVSEDASLTQNTAPSLPAGRKLIRTITLDVETDVFDNLLTSLQEDVSRLEGYIEQSDISGRSLYNYGKPASRTASLTVRIPINQADAFLSSVEKNANVTNRSENTQDVTLQYSDLESKKKSLEIEQEKIWEFLEKAESIDTVITLQERLSEIRYQLESMESQLRLYDNQIDYSTIYLSIEEVTAFTPAAPESVGVRIKNGFSRNLAAFTDGVVGLFVGLITTSPFWVPLALAAGAVIWLLKRRKKNTAAPAKPDHKTPES